MQRRTPWIIAAAIAVVALGLAGANFYLDLLWFKELQFEGIFWTEHLTRWGVQAASWLLVFVLILVNLLFTRRDILNLHYLALR